ncbi:transposase [Mycoplasma sp. 4013]
MKKPILTQEQQLDILKQQMQFFIDYILRSELYSYIKNNRKIQVSKNFNSKNGFYERTLNTQIGKIKIYHPRLRTTRFVSVFIQKYNRESPAFLPNIFYSYAHNVKSSDKIEYLSNIMSSYDKEIQNNFAHAVINNACDFMQTPIEKVCDSLYLNKINIKNDFDDKFNEYYYLITKNSNNHQIICIWLNDDKNENYWTVVLNDLKQRGLQRIKHIYSNNHRFNNEAVNIFGKVVVHNNLE